MRPALALVLGLFALPASAHEMWIEPLDYTVAMDGRVEARIVNGQDFAGSAVALFPPRIARFGLVLGEQEREVEGRPGDNPALAMEPLGEGLHIAVYQSAGDLLTYDNYAVFARFAEHKDFAGIHRRHHDRGLPDAGFTETYTRYSKALIAVGDGAGADRPLGLTVELVALANPYTDDLSAGLPVLAHYEGAPRVDAQVELFDKAPDGSVEVSYYRTDEEGIVLLPVTPGHSYLVDAVVMREPSAGISAETGAVWESLWAALTFAVPD